MNSERVFKNRRVRRMLVMVEAGDGNGCPGEINNSNILPDNLDFENISSPANPDSLGEQVPDYIDNTNIPPDNHDLENIPSPTNPVYLNYLNSGLHTPSSISNISEVMANIDFIASPNIIHKVTSNMSTPTSMVLRIRNKQAEKTYYDLDTENLVNDKLPENDNNDIPLRPSSPQELPLQTDNNSDISPLTSKQCTVEQQSFAGDKRLQQQAEEHLILTDCENSNLNINVDLNKDLNVDESSSMSTSSPPSRKRRRREKEWQDYKNKKLKNLGKSYKSVRSKKTRPQKTMGEVCACNKKCFEKFDTEIRQGIFKKFWGIGDHEHQWQYILKHVKREDIKRMKVVRKNNRTQTLKYYFPLLNSESMQVCKKMFLNTLSISDTFVYTALEKEELHENIVDNRGRHDNRPRKINMLTEESIKTHIKLFPVVESHYVRQQSKRLYLSQQLNISEMYRLYQEWFKTYQQEHPGTTEATKRQYTTIFNTKFNYSFFKPKKDRCATCAIYEEADSARKLTLEEEFQNHLKRKNKIREIKTSEKENADRSNSVVATFDLEKVLNVPQSNVGIFHYKRKYPIYNFTIHNSLSGKGHCYVWHYQIAKRGAVEIGSCLLKFIELECEKGITQFSFYSDSCVGQNKNRFIFALYLYLAKKLQIDITHRFFEVRHSQSEGDSIHSCIERAKNNKIIYTPEQMYSIILNAKKSGEKYDLMEMQQSEFLNIRSLIIGKNWIRDTSGNKILWSKIKEVYAKSSQPDTLLFKYDFDDDYSKVLTKTNKSLRRRKSVTQGASTSSASDEQLLPMYVQPIAIPKPLYNDLMSLCSSNAIPLFYQSFYKTLKCDNSSNYFNHKSDCETDDSE